MSNDPTAIIIIFMTAVIGSSHGLTSRCSECFSCICKKTSKIKPISAYIYTDLCWQRHSWLCSSAVSFKAMLPSASTQFHAKIMSQNNPFVNMPHILALYNLQPEPSEKLWFLMFLSYAAQASPLCYWLGLSIHFSDKV